MIKFEHLISETGQDSFYEFELVNSQGDVIAKSRLKVFDSKSWLRQGLYSIVLNSDLKEESSLKDDEIQAEINKTF